jgi:O-antigen ligase
MPPLLALCITICCVVFLFRRDFREHPNVTRALWIPLFWCLLMGSRFTSGWLAIFGISAGAISLEEGSPVDAVVFCTLIVSAAWVVYRRRIRLASFIHNNRWLIAFLAYCFLAILWSDFPFVAFKRWIKILGHPLMVLVLFSEPDFEEAFVCLFKRCAYFLILGSVLCIKYYPDIGRGYDPWSGAPFFRGLTLNKNEMGYVCLILGFFLFWHLLRTRRMNAGTPRRNELLLTLGLLSMNSWLLWLAHSSTALVSLLVGVLVVVFLGLNFINRQRIGTYTLVAAALFTVCEWGFGVTGEVIKLLGKDPTLTDRTKIWHDVLQIPINPVLGAGFESFWLGQRRELMWAKWDWQPNQAHNGYLETYLNLGLLGLFILLALIIATFWKSRRELLSNFEFGRFRLGFLAAVVVYNWTEASFKALSFVWFVFFIIAIDYPTTRSSVVEDSAATTLDSDTEWVSVPTSDAAGLSVGNRQTGTLGN